MRAASDGDVGWQRRYRTTDLAAALLFGAAPPTAAHLGSAAMISMVIAGIVLIITYRERRLERVGSDIWLIEIWWFFQPLRVSRRAVLPARVVLTMPERGWLARRRTLLCVDGQQGPIVLERWRHPSERIYAIQLAADLARWFGVSATGVLAPFDARPEGPPRWSALRDSLQTLKGVPGDSKDPAPLPYRLSGRRPAWEAAIGIWMLLVGIGLISLSRLASLASRVDAFALLAALPLGALLATQGLAGVLPGRIRAEIAPAGLHVERLGLRRDVLLHIPFRNVTWVGAPNRLPKRPTLQIGCGDALANLTARTLGLKPEAFEKFCGVYRRALTDWLDRHVDKRAGGAISDGPPAPPTGPVALDDRRAAPNSVVTVFAQLAPRFSVVLSGVFLVALFLLARGPAYPVLRMPSHVRPEAPHLLPFFALKTILGVAGFASMAAALAIVGCLFLSAPATRWHFALMIPLLACPLFLAGMGGFESMEVLDCWNVCAGLARPAKYPVLADGFVLKYGPYEYVGHQDSRFGSDSRWFKDLSEERELIDVDGVLGGKYLLSRSAYHATCDAWRAHLPAALRKERLQ